MDVPNITTPLNPNHLRPIMHKHPIALALVLLVTLLATTGCGEQ